MYVISVRTSVFFNIFKVVHIHTTYLNVRIASSHCMISLTIIIGCLLQDIWDGEMWTHFQEEHGGFLQNPNHIGLTIYVDWFKPFKNSEYKVRGIFMSILNLPKGITLLHNP